MSKKDGHRENLSAQEREDASLRALARVDHFLEAAMEAIPPMVQELLESPTEETIENVQHLSEGLSSLATLLVDLDDCVAAITAVQDDLNPGEMARVLRDLEHAQKQGRFGDCAEILRASIYCRVPDWRRGFQLRLGMLSGGQAEASTPA